MCHPMMIMKLRTTMNNTYNSLMMKTHKRCYQIFRKKIYMLLTVIVTEMKRIINLMITRKTQIKKRFKYTEKTMIENIKRKKH